MLIHAQDGILARSYVGHKFNNYCLIAAFSLTGGKCIVSGSADKSICIWDINTMDLLQRLTGHTGMSISCGT